MTGAEAVALPTEQRHAADAVADGRQGRQGLPDEVVLAAARREMEEVAAMVEEHEIRITYNAPNDA